MSTDPTNDTNPTGTMGLAMIDGDAVRRLLSPREAIAAIERALRDGLRPEDEPARANVPSPTGHLLVMPSASEQAVAVKLASVAPGNAEQGLPRIQGVVVLFDDRTLAPTAIVDAVALTALRTAAVSAVAVDRLAVPDARRLLVFGTGPQAWAHVEALRAIRPIEHVDVVARDHDRTEAFVARCREAGLDARAGDPTTDLVRAEIVCCCTSAHEPLFDGRLVADSATVVAVGSHEPDVRELDEQLVGRATVVVESRSSALREAGEIVQAVAAGVCTPEALVPLDELVRGTVDLPTDRPRLFKSTGMAWEDAVIAAAVHRRSLAETLK